MFAVLGTRISEWFYRLLIRFMLHQWSKEPAESREVIKRYHSNGRVYVVTRKIILKNGGISEESRIYRDNGKILSLSQKMIYEKDKYIRYTDWSDLGHRRMDFAARNNKSLYFKYYPAYFNETSSSATISNKEIKGSSDYTIRWWLNRISND